MYSKSNRAWQPHRAESKISQWISRNSKCWRRKKVLPFLLPFPGTVSATIIDFTLDFVVGVRKQLFFLFLFCFGFRVCVESRIRRMCDNLNFTLSANNSQNLRLALKFKVIHLQVQYHTYTARNHRKKWSSRLWLLPQRSIETPPLSQPIAPQWQNVFLW